MSRDFHYRCATCDPANEGWSAHWGRGADLNWQGDRLLALLPFFPMFAALAAAGFEVDPESLELYGSYRPGGLAAYAMAHQDHDVQVWDEYGERWPEPSGGSATTGGE